MWCFTKGIEKQVIYLHNLVSCLQFSFYPKIRIFFHLFTALQWLMLTPISNPYSKARSTQPSIMCVLSIYPKPFLSKTPISLDLPHLIKPNYMHFTKWTVVFVFTAHLLYLWNGFLVLMMQIYPYKYSLHISSAVSVLNPHGTLDQSSIWFAASHAFLHCSAFTFQ